MAEASDCKRRLIKIDTNNVELQYYLLSPVTLEKVVLPEYTVSYGQTKINTDRTSVDAEELFWAGLDAPQLADKIVECEKQVEYYDKVQEVMNDINGTIKEIE